MPRSPEAEPLQVLYEDNHCLAVWKPARLLTTGDQTGDESLQDQVRDYLKHKYNKPGNVFVGLVHRLDRPVSGVVLFARTSKGAARLSEQFRVGSIVKVYHAIVEGRFETPAGELVNYLLKNHNTNVVQSVPRGTPGAKESRLRYQVLKSAGGLTRVEITPETGRSHQIRVQLAERGHPICGDGKYGSSRNLQGTIALHAARLTFDHPTRHEPLTVTAPEPAHWAQWFPGLC
ncbi:MAG: RluA family pseudouridine synthase [Planctomycetes bacterium]|nr:RluA family pseudouridine synthase [Planctomycetota bacterium]